MLSLNNPRFNILMAIPYIDSNSLAYLRDIGPSLRFFLDSGAFTAWKKGSEIHLDTFCKTIETLPFQPWRYFTLDKIGNAQGTKDNFGQLLKRGFKPVPIFTRGEDLEELEFYYEHSDMIGIGGLVGTGGNRGFVKGIMEHVKERKCHWLGFTSQDFVTAYKPYSCDSSSWSGAVRFGTIKLYCGQGKWITLTKEDFFKMPSREVRAQFDIYGEDIRRLAQKEEWINSGKGDHLLEVMTCKSWARYSLDVEKVIGSRYFLACASFWQVKLMHEAFLYWTSRPGYTSVVVSPSSSSS